MNLFMRWRALELLMVVLVALAGCNGASEPSSDASADGHDHDAGHGHSHGDGGHDHAHADHALPESFAEAMAEVTELHTKIKEGFTGDDVDAAHGPLHDMGRVLEALPKLAGEASLSEEDQQQVSTSVDALMDAYGAVDERLHADDSVGKSYDEVADQIDEAMASLQAIEVPESQP